MRARTHVGSFRRDYMHPKDAIHKIVFSINVFPVRTKTNPHCVVIFIQGGVSAYVGRYKFGNYRSFAILIISLLKETETFTSECD